MFCLLLLSGCERGVVTDENSPGVGTDELIPISVHVDGIEDFYGGAVTRGGTSKESFRQALDTVKDSGYDVVTTYETVQPEPSVKTRATLANVRFRLLAYKTSISASNYAGQCDYLTNGSGVAAAQTAAMKLSPGNYVFVCYSYGTNADLPAFNGSSETTISVVNGQDFMTWQSAKVNVTLNASGQYTLSGITFTRLCSQLEICVKAAGFSGNNNITYCAGTVSGLSNTPAKWSVGASDISTSGTSGSVEITWPSINNTTAVSNRVIVLPASSRQVTVKLTKLSIKDNPNFDNKVSVTTPARQFSKQGSYRITLTIEPNYIPACSYMWAKGNLSSSGVVEATQDTYGGYFGWNTLSTAKNQYNGGSYSVNNDPCYMVEPRGTWYTPSQNQLLNLINCNRSPSSGTGMYFADNKIYLKYGGLRNESGEIIVRDRFAYYWSRDSEDNGSGHSLYIGYSVTVSAYSRSNGHLVRCVKGK